MQSTAYGSRGVMMKRIATTVGLALALSAGAVLAAESPEAINNAAAKVAVNLCSSCHGPAGDSISPTFPKLAGQQKLYLAAQLRALKDKSRSDPEAHDYMWGIAATLDEALVDGLASYYSSQKPAAGTPGDPALIAQGKQLFESGDNSRKITACASCHGTNAEGSAIFPRLAGQHAAYILRQLQVIQTSLRKSPVMHGLITELKLNDMKAVAEFLQSK
jgi:cytochrome c553